MLEPNETGKATSFLARRSSQNASDGSDSETESGPNLIQKSPRKRGRSRKSVLETDEIEVPLDANGQLDVQKFFGEHSDWQSDLEKCLEKLHPNCLTVASDFFKITECEQEKSENTDKDEFNLDLSTFELTRVVKHRRQSEDFDDELNVVSDDKEVTKPRNDDPVPKASTSSEENIEDLDQDESSGAEFKTPKPRCRKFIFKPFKRNSDGCLEHDETKEPVDVVIPEQMAASYGLYLWPCAPVLSWYIWLRQDDIRGKNVLELGSGTALPGLLCSKIPAAKVWLSDDSWQPDTLKNIREAVKINAVEEKTETIGLTWGEYTEELFQFSETKLDFVIGSDLFFDPDVFEPLLITIAYLLEDNPNAEVLVAVQERSSDWSMEEYLIEWKLKCSYIFPREFLRGTGIEEADLVGKHSIFILKIFRDSS